MCGHFSVFKKNKDYNINREKAVNALDRIKHRGPDDDGIYEDDRSFIGFRRLSIIDLENGHQPFDKNDFVMIFNGEIYNYKELMEELKGLGHSFSTNSDTEVLLTSFIEYGPSCTEKLRGMFSFIIYNKKNGEVFGGRDQFGIKPLYYLNEDNIISFASEYKSLLDVSENLTVNKEALQNYLSYQFVPNQLTMFSEIKEVPAGNYFILKDGKLTFKEYFTLDYKKDKEVSKEELFNTIKDSVNKHMVSDVEVGTFLSGGIDSTIISALAKEENPKIKSFTVGFGVENYDEIAVAKKSAEYLNIENIHINITEDDYINVLPEIVYKLDEPVADPSLVGLYFLSREASKYVKVVLSGEGADELFGGYNIYGEYYSVKPFLRMPRFFTRAINSLVKRLPRFKGRNYLERATTPLSERYIGNAKIFSNDEAKKLLKYYSKDNDFEVPVKNYYDTCTKEDYNYIETMQYVDIKTWLQGDILVKADRMSMGNSLELRVPFLDKEVFKVSKQLKLKQKISRKNTKVLLREAFKDILPPHMVEKKKLGFPTPIRVWLKGRLGNIVENTIKDAKVDEYINKDYALELLKEHREGKMDNSRKVWTVFVFCLWHQIHVEGLKINFSFEEESQKAV